MESATVGRSNDYYDYQDELDQPDEFTLAYLEAALWSSNDDDDRPLDDRFSVYDFTRQARGQIYADCAKFQKENQDLICGCLSDWKQAVICLDKCLLDDSIVFVKGSRDMQLDKLVDEVCQN